MKNADVVFYGSLINEEIIRKYAPNAKRVYIGHVRRVDHDKYVEEALRYAKEGLNVVFLKNGDPTLFGRGIEICRRAREAGIECMVVPGVSSFTAAAARFLIELKGPLLLSAYPDLGEVPNTRVIFMGSKAMGDLLASLRDDEVAYIASRVTYPDERLFIVRKGDDLPDARPPLLVIIKRIGGPGGI